MLEHMQQEIVSLRSKIDGSGPSNTSQGLNVGSSIPTIQIRTPYAAPNTVATTGTPTTTSVGQTQATSLRRSCIRCSSVKQRELAGW